MLREAIEFLRTRQKVTLMLLAANVAVFVVLSVLGDTLDSTFMLAHGACYTPKILEGEYWRLFTSMFLHFGLPHLLHNMVCLLALGDILEKIIGHARFTLIYVGGGLVGNWLSTWMEISRGGNFAVSAGASGAIFAGVGSLLWLVLTHQFENERIRPERMVILAILMTSQGFMEAGTNRIAHVGGLAAGFVLSVLLLWPGRGREKR